MVVHFKGLGTIHLHTSGKLSDFCRVQFKPCAIPSSLHGWAGSPSCSIGEDLALLQSDSIHRNIN